MRFAVTVRSGDSMTVIDSSTVPENRAEIVSQNFNRGFNLSPLSIVANRQGHRCDAH